MAKREGQAKIEHTPNIKNKEERRGKRYEEDTTAGIRDLGSRKIPIENHTEEQKQNLIKPMDNKEKFGSGAYR